MLPRPRPHGDSDGPDAPRADAGRGWLPAGQTVVLNRTPIPPGRRVLVLAPHPDDFDAIAVTLRRFRDNGNPIHLAVLTAGASGVEGGFGGAVTRDDKGRLREAEQRASCALFGLPESQLQFVGLAEDGDGHPLDDAANTRRLAGILASSAPAVVFLPHGNDTNAGHRRVHRMFLRAVAALPRPPVALLACDPKTLAMVPTVFTVFDDGAAEWKARLLRCHDSQQQRNLHTRGHGLDDRILNVNRRIARQHPELNAAYAEAFETAGLHDAVLPCGHPRPPGSQGEP
ncbi:MAG: GlcNAc-PI de-N-acetylase [Lentisphaerae bacterium ADurb.BinA184]|nr:MAG: GlcNAc-PI de-N-acetylase [Lentisphaerae bacterium ADurb.BinA184]